LANSLPMTLRVYRKLSYAMVPLSPALISRRLKLGKEDPARFGERRGMSTDVRPAGPLVWIHGASVGEVLAAAALIERLRALNLRILLTSGTVTSAAIVAKRFPADVIHQYVPYDSPRYVARFLDHWRPSLALFIESDLWPNLILSSAARRLPMVLINGRMSQRSFPRWQRVQGTISALLEKFDVCLAQSQTDADRFAALGSRNVVVTGNLKLDVPAPPADANKLDMLMSMTRGRPVVVAASTHPGEEEILTETHRALAGYFPKLLTVIVPRHPDRGEAIARMITASGLNPTLRSHEDWGCSTGWRRSCSWADRWSSMAGRIRSRRSSSARRSFTAPTSSISPTSMKPSMPPAARGGPIRRKRWSSISGRCSPIPRRAKPC
jgi:3-deoxy-D-manno-octulosonic-acid transferase